MTQKELFVPEENPNIEKEERAMLHRQLVTLGDILGDGCGEDNPYYEKEYRRVMKLLYPDIFARKRKLKADAVNKAVAEVIQEKNCPKCNGMLKQSRKGSKVVICCACAARFKLGNKKKKRDNEKS